MRRKLFYEFLRMTFESFLASRRAEVICFSFKIYLEFCCPFVEYSTAHIISQISNAHRLYFFNFLSQDFNYPVIIEVRHWFVAQRAFKEKFKCFCEGKSPAAWRLASIELVVFLVLKPSFQFF